MLSSVARVPTGRQQRHTTGEPSSGVSPGPWGRGGTGRGVKRGGKGRGVVPGRRDEEQSHPKPHTHTHTLTPTATVFTGILTVEVTSTAKHPPAEGNTMSCVHIHTVGAENMFPFKVNFAW